MSTRPTIVLIPGSFCFADMYDVVAESVRAKGHEIHVVEPPCYPAGYNRSGPPPSLYADAKYVNDFVTNLANQGKEVVIVAHSYGGVVATESLKGITKKEREQKGEKGGVVRVAYLGAVVPAIGESCFQTIGGGAPTPVIPDENGWLTQGDFTALAAYCCSDLPLEEGIVQVSKMGKHFGGCMVEPVTYAGHKDVPVSWFFTAKDKTVLPEVQQKSIDRIESGWVGTEREGKKVDVTRVECDHAPLFLEDKREKLIQWIDEVVEKGGRD